MALVKDDKKQHSQNVDSLQNINRSKTCAKLSSKISSASPQHTHLFSQAINTHPNPIHSVPLAWFQNNKGDLQ